PNCGLPIQPTVVEERPVVTRAAVRREGFPAWAWVPIGALAVAILIIGILLFRSNDDSSNVNVAMNARRAEQNRLANSSTTTTTVPSSGPQSVTVPGEAPVVTTGAPPVETTVPGTSSAPVAPPPDKGTAVIKARIVSPRGGTSAARGTKFYLLDKDIETILSEARVEPIEGNTLSASIGLAAVFPDRYGEFQRAAMRAISAHVKYSGTTDASGAASVKGIKPDSYYLFAITRAGRGFAMWDSSVSIVPGDNVLDLSPQSITEIPDTNG
ncbi:MAG: hypothetical protein JO053_14360, partial [Acidobacteria bacterium]|nr:hypothetical protein [Acidobacteriota bacterium]